MRERPSVTDSQLFWRSNDGKKWNTTTLGLPGHWRRPGRAAARVLFAKSRPPLPDPRSGRFGGNVFQEIPPPSDAHLEQQSEYGLHRCGEEPSLGLELVAERSGGSALQELFEEVLPAGR